MKIKRQDTSIPVFSYVMDIFLFSHPLQLLITQHSLVQFFLHPVNEIGAAFVLPPLNKFIQVSGSPARIMACAPRTPDELSYLMSTGATSVALDPEDFENCFNARLFINLNQDVRRSWEAVFGNVGADELID